MTDTSTKHPPIECFEQKNSDLLDAIVEGGHEQICNHCISGVVKQVEAASGHVLVKFDFAGKSYVGLNAQSHVPFNQLTAGQNCTLIFHNGQLHSPVVHGVIQQPDHHQRPKHLELEAAESITIQSGKASLTLTEDGDVLIRGKRVSSESTGINQVRGGSVKLN